MRGLLVIAGLLALPGAAFAEVTDYSAGKTPAQLFAGDCAACHNSPRGLAKGRDQSSLANFLREHYTTKAETAGSIATYLLGNPGTASEPRNATGRQPRGTPASAPAAAPAPKPAEDDPFRRIFRGPSAEPDTDEGSIVAPEEGAPAAKQKGKPRTAARPPAEPAARSPKDAAKELAKEKEAAKPKKPESSEAAREAAKAEEAAKEAAAKEAAAKAEAAKAEAAKVRAYITGGEPAARVKDSEPATPSPDRPASTPPG